MTKSTSKSTTKSKPKTQKAKKVTPTKKEKTASKVVFPDPPKNKRNAYTFFFREKRGEVNDANPNDKFGEITSKVANLWNNLADSEKRSYVKKAAKDVKRYEKERAKWDKEVRELGSEPNDVLRERREAKKRRRNRVKPPRGPRNPYVLFSIDKRKDLKGEGLAFDKMTKRLGLEWGKVSAKDKKKYTKKAVKDKERYAEEMKKFREEHPEQDESKKGKRRRKKEGEPKNPRNSYIFFSNDERAKVRAENPDMAPKLVMTELGARWKKLEKDDKSKYIELAENDRKRYAKEMTKWNASQATATTA